jgi:predicted helicase
MHALNLKPAHKAVKAYFDELNAVAHLDFYGEGAVSPAFAELLRHCGRQSRLTLVEQFPLAKGGRTLRVDGALVDNFKIPHGYWEAKDTKDDLEKEIQKKFEAGYPRDNILFQAPHRAIIYQNGQVYFNEDISQPEQLVAALKTFFDYQPPHYEEWQTAVNEFKDKLPEHAAALLSLIREQYHTNKDFIQAFDGFATLCRQALNPNLADAAVEEMIIQHILTERIFRKIFDNPDFVKRNIIAHEIDKVIQALTSQSFSSDAFLKKLDRFYHAIEATAASIEDYSQKQSFLNTVYERFFQGFSVKVADTHGIVYTPQPIVDFMVRSVDSLLRAEFGRSLGDPGVHILDPFVGTGNFIMRLMREIPKTRLDPKYANELHCNEVMLLPYYIASMNIEHAYFEATGTYKPFEGICLVDTFELAEKGQRAFKFAEENIKRVEKQQKSPIFVIIGNPPYNAGQVNENDNNKTRKYEMMDRRVRDTYAKASNATLVRKYNDPYIKAIRFATDRIGPEGVVAFVTNHSFVIDPSFDGVRKYLEDDFDLIYILDLGGNVRKNPKLSGTTHNVFGIQPGVSINLFLKRSESPKKAARIFYARTDEWWRKEEKYRFLEQADAITRVTWEEIVPDSKHTWLTEGLQEEFEYFMPIGTKSGKHVAEAQISTVFQTYSLGVSTNRDTVVHGFEKDILLLRIKQFAEKYNTEVLRYIQAVNEARKTFENPVDIDSFVQYKEISWSRNLKRHLKNNDNIVLNKKCIVETLYRPFTNKVLYLSDIIVDEPGENNKYFPNKKSELENKIICVPSVGGRADFWCLCSNKILNLNLVSIDAGQCFPFYVYEEDGANRRENLTDWAWQEYRAHYHDEAIAKWDIFHYVYGLLHHPAYREKYAANLRRELPRIPFAPDFWGFAKAGARLAEIHVHYEKQPEYPLKYVEKPGAALNWRVDKMKLTPDKTALIYNNFLTLEGIPPEVFDYKLGNRSALDWVIDQYKVSTDPRSGITNDPNRPDDPQYIVRLIGQVITVSLETLKIIAGLPGLK